MVTAWDVHQEWERTERRVYVGDGPIDFATWLELSERMDTELVRGVIREKMSAQYPHEWIFAWLLTALTNFVSVRKLGRVLGSRMAVRITENDGRLPDLVFVRAENMSIIRKDAIHGVPDLVIEIVSENDRPSDLVPLEADYRSLGVSEIVFIDPRKQRVRWLRKTENGYGEATLTNGPLTLASVPGFHVEVEWLFVDDRPEPFTVAQNLLAEANARQ